ncbi:sensor histidine kinase [Antribacter gilvus]|uniref:sensor histidine kinase n=1 Tax=Antribacter gilvus TaxID=2304675 RepID=UPI000F7ABD18|nr:HAMP domain-containing sensor histidine kinase [Antribacter gilvus]
MTDVQFMVLVTAACAVAVGLVGFVAVRWARRVSLVLALVLAALVPFAAVVAALAVNVSAMFLSPHDAFVVRLVLGTASVLAVALALALGRTVAREVQLLVDGARRLAQGSEAPAPTSAPATAELAQVVAELETTRERLAQARDAERRAQDARREIVGFVSHDLLSPLAGIRAATDGLRAGVFDEPTTALDGIAAAVDRMSRMIADLGELSRSDAPPVRPEARRVDVGDVLRGVLAHATPAAAESGVTVEARIEDEVTVQGDPGELGRVLDNLVSNAIRSSGRGGWVLVGVARADGAARVTVQDTCGGIPDEDVPHLFRPGYQGAGARAAPGEAGLGLAYVDRVVDEHGGRVAVSSTDGGCNVEVRLPVTE